MPKTKKKSPRRAATRARRPAARPAKRAGLPRVADVMTSKVVVVRADTSLEVAVALMVDEDLSRLPVVDADGRCIGVISKTDLVTARHLGGDTQTWSDEAQLPRRPGVSEMLSGSHTVREGETAGDLMSKHVLAVRAGDTLRAAADTLASHHLHGLPVLDGAGVVIGMLSALDIAAWVARGAEKRA